MRLIWLKWDLSAALVIFIFVFGSTAVAQVTSSTSLAHPKIRILQPVDASSTVAIAGSHLPVVDHVTRGERVDGDLLLSGLRMMLSPTEEQESSLQTLMSEQQNPQSKSYHQWLTPKQFGEQFGAAPEDIAKIKSWLESQGLQVNDVSNSQRIITFSGKSSHVESAFHTQIRHFTVDGEDHIGNVSDLQVARSFANVISGILPVTDLQPRHHRALTAKADESLSSLSSTQIVSPAYSSTDATPKHYMTPGDAAIIYNAQPVYQAGFDGTGQKIAIVGITDVNLADIEQFRSMFGLKPNDPSIIHVGNDPGYYNDGGEAYLDLEWAGSLAPGAQVIYLTGGNNNVTSPAVANAAQYAVNNNVADIIAVSYATCEVSYGQYTLSLWNVLWQQAAAQGQSVFISSGDDSSADCQSSGAGYGVSYGVNAIASSPYDVAVGGTMFVDYGPSQYWSAGVAGAAPAGYTFTTALGYIPEGVWNQGALSTTYLNAASTGLYGSLSGIAGSGGGLSAYNARPEWQVGSGIDPAHDVACSSGACIADITTGTASTIHRMMPDVSFNASSGHVPSAFCAEGTCSNTSTGYTLNAIGGTSLAAPAVASIQALINQKNGGRQGNPNVYYYKLANQDYVSGNCQTPVPTASVTSVPTLPGATCNFHDIIAGSNRVLTSSTDATPMGFDALQGYDAASGLGSMNIANVVNNWSTVTASATATVLTLQGSATTNYNSGLSFNVSVSAANGSQSIPTGDVVIFAVTATPVASKKFTLSANAEVTDKVYGLPGGTYNIYAHYSGDMNYASSDSAVVQITVNQIASSVALTVNDYPSDSSSTHTLSPASIHYGDVLAVVGQVAPNTNTYTTGQMTFTVTPVAGVASSVTVNLDGKASGALVAGGNVGSMVANYSMLIPGTYAIKAKFLGNTSLAASTSSAYNITVTTGTPKLSLTMPTNINSGDTVTVAVSLSPPLSVSQATWPTGVVTVTDSTTATLLGSCAPNGSGLCSFQSTAIAGAGTHTLTASSASDALWNATSATQSLTVDAITATTTTLVATGVAGSSKLTATINSSNATGSVNFYDGSVLIGTGTIAGGVATLSTSALTAAQHILIAQYSGSSVYASSTGSLTKTFSVNPTTLTLSGPTQSTAGLVNLSVLIGRTGSGQATIAPTGAITFYDNNVAIVTASPILPGWMPYSGNYEGLLTYQFGSGVHTIKASFAGDANYASSTSATLQLEVPSGNLSIAHSSGNVTGVTSGGSQVFSNHSGGVGLAIDGSGNIWSLNTVGSSLAKFTSNGTVVSAGYTGGGMNAPAALAVDGAGTMWVVGLNSLSSFTNAGVASPASGFAMATSTPTSVSVDASGNVWFANAGDNSVVQILGVASPVMTPLVSAVINNALGIKP